MIRVITTIKPKHRDIVHVPYEHHSTPGVCAYCGLPMWAIRNRRHMTLDDFLERVMSEAIDDDPALAAAGDRAG